MNVDEMIHSLTRRGATLLYVNLYEDRVDVEFVLGKLGGTFSAPTLTEALNQAVEAA